MKKVFFTLLISISLLFNSYAQDAQYVYGPVSGVTLDDMFAAADKLFRNNDLKTESFKYAKGVIKSSSYDFVVLINQYRCNVEVKHTDNGVYISFVDLQMKVENKYKEATMVLGKKPKKLISSLGKKFEEIAGNAKEVNNAKVTFFNEPNTHYLFFKKATDLAVDRWYENYMKEKPFEWTLEFRDIKKNETSKHTEYKYIVTARYYTGTSLMGSEGLYVRLYTNSDKNTMTEKGSKVTISGTCVGFEKAVGYYLIDFIAK